MYRIAIYQNGKQRVYKFKTFEEAQKVANSIFVKTGIVVGIEYS